MGIALIKVEGFTGGEDLSRGLLSLEKLEGLLFKQIEAYGEMIEIPGELMDLQIKISKVMDAVLPLSNGVLCLQDVINGQKRVTAEEILRFWRLFWCYRGSEGASEVSAALRFVNQALKEL